MEASVSIKMIKDGKRFCKMNLASEMKRYRELATDFLLFRDFKNCQATCLNGIAHAKRYIEDSRAKACIEGLCVLCIQALAEMNKWQEVLPLVQNVYTGIETCPYTVIQLCLLLHAKVKEFAQCHAIASIWLRCEDNCCQSGYAEVASLYTKQIMLPQGQLVLVPQFLNSCTSLDMLSKQRIIEECETLSKERTKGTGGDNVDDTVSDEKQKSAEDGALVHKDTYPDSSIMKFAKSLGCMIGSKLAYPSVKLLLKVAMVALSFSILAKLTLQGDLMSHVDRAAVIWQATLKVLKSIFTPYRPGR